MLSPNFYHYTTRLISNRRVQLNLNLNLNFCIFNNFSNLFQTIFDEGLECSTEDLLGTNEISARFCPEFGIPKKA